MKYSLQDLQPRLEDFRKVCAPEKAGKTGDVGVDNLSISLNKENAIRRKWKDIPAKDIYIYKALLDHYTDASNNGPKSYVDDPVIGDGQSKQVQATGRYRQALTIVRCVREDEYELIQELRLGWIQSLVSGSTVDYSEARCEGIDWFVGDAGDNTTNDYITLVWKGVDPTKSEAIVESLLDLSSSGWEPTVNGNSLGTHHRLYARAAEESDGSHSIRLLLANSRLKFTAYSNYGTERNGDIVYHFGVPSDLVQAVLDTEAAVGVSARVSQPDGRGLHAITIDKFNPTAINDLNRLVGISCSEKDYQSSYYGLTEAEADAVTLPSSTDKGDSYTLRRQPIGNGYYDVIVVLRQTQQRNPLDDELVEIRGDRTTNRDQWLGYTESTRPDFSEEAGKIKQRNIRVADDCSEDITDDKVTGVDIQTDASVERADYTESRESHSVADAEAELGDLDDNQTGELVNRPSIYPQKFETDKVIRTRIDQRTESYDKNRVSSRVTVGNTQADQPADPGDVNDGLRVIVVRPTDTRKFAVEDMTETPRAWDSGWVDYPNREGVQVRVYTNSVNPYFGASADDATEWPNPTGTNTLQPQQKQNGRYDLFATSRPDADTDTTEVDRCDFTEITVRVGSSDVEVEIGDRAYNQHVTIRNIEKADGTFETVRVVRTYLNQTGEEWRKSPAETLHTEVETHVDPDSDTLAEPDAPTEGEVILRVSPTETCAKRRDETTITPVELDSGWIPHLTRSGYAFSRYIINATSATVTGFAWPATVGEITVGDISYYEQSFSSPIQPNGRYNVTARLIPRELSIRFGGTATGESYEYEIQIGPRTFHIGVKYTTSLDTAQEYLEEVVAGASDTNVGGAGVTPGISESSGKFKAVRVRQIS